MLVAFASVGLIAPTAAQASDALNLEGINDYKSSSKSSSKKYFDSKTFDNESNEKLAKTNNSELGIENSQPIFEAGSFSDTTTFDGKVVFSAGAINALEKVGEAALGESVRAHYMWQGNLNTSFTGDDNLYVRLKSGNTEGWMKSKTYGTYLSSAKGNTDALKVDKIWYTFPVGEKHTFWIGPKIENYYMHGTTPSIYKPVTKQFTLGGNGAAYGASTNPGIGYAYKADNGFAFSTNAVSKEGDATGGWGTSESATSWATQIGITKPTYSASVIVNMKYNGWQDGYYSTASGLLRPTAAGVAEKGDSTNIGLRGWWRPEDSGKAIPSISVGYDTSETDASTNSNTTAYFVGLSWTDAFNVDDRIGVAFGQPQTREDEAVDPFAWEAYYSYAVNDSITVTPAVFGTTDRTGVEGRDVKGAVIETTFKF